MEVDNVSVPLNTGDDAQQPIRRARRTYGKPKQAISHEEKSGLDDGSSSSSSLPVNGHTQLTGALSRYADWKERLDDVDKVSSEEEGASRLSKRSRESRLHAPIGSSVTRAGLSAYYHSGLTQQNLLSSTVLRSAIPRNIQSSVSSPTETAHGDDSSREHRSPAQRITSAIETQYSANTSINSGTTGAASSPAWPSPQKTTTRNLVPSRPGPPPHQESFLSDEQESMHPSSDEGSGVLPAIELPREITPDIQRTNSTRLLPPSPFRSPVKSFSSATASVKQRRPHKYLGADSDDEGDAQMNEINTVANEEKDEHAWFTDGEDETTMGKGKGKVKQPSKKSIIEAEKETARMRAERDVDVQDKAVYRPLPWGDYFQKRVEDLRHSALGKPPSAPQPFGSKDKSDLNNSDPISSFSSPHDTLISKDMKMRLIARRPTALDNEDDSDLEIIEEEKPRDPIGKLQGVFDKHHKTLPHNQKKIKQLSAPGGSKQEKSRKDHNREMLQKISAQSSALAASKRNDFESRGGVLTKQHVMNDKRQHLVQILQRGVTVSQYRQPEEESDEDDPSYRAPEEDQVTVSGSSPKKRVSTVLVADSSLIEAEDEDEDDVSDHGQEGPLSTTSERNQEDEFTEDVKAHLSRRNVILSDDEVSLLESDEENVPPLTDSAVSKSSAAFRFDLSDVLSQAPRTPLADLRVDGKKLSRALFTQPDLSPTQSSPSQRHSSFSFNSSESSPAKALPLLPAFDEPSSVKSFEKFSSPPVFPLLLGGEEKRAEFPSGRSTASSIGFKPAGFGELSTQLFLSQGTPSQRASPCKRSRASVDKKDPLGDLRKAQDNDFLLTQPGPLGRIQLSTQEEKEIRRLEQADADAVLQENEEERRRRIREAVEEEEEPRWINDAGLFTQTKPKDLPWSLSQNLLSQNMFSQDIPFFPRGGELNAEQLLSQRSPAKTPARPRRLVRMGDVAVATSPSSPVSDTRSVASSPEKEHNAFTVLMKPRKKRPELALNYDFVAGEAEESDDELHLGFKRTQGDEDEDEADIDPEEMAKMLNDQQMTKEEIAGDAVLEKHKEQEAADDAARQKMVEKLVNGQSRKHKRGYDPLGDSSSDDETRARPRQFKKRRVKGTDDMDGIAANPDTAAFFNSYCKDLPGVEHPGEEDDTEFAHLRVENKITEDVDEDGDIESGSEAGMSGMSDEVETKQTWTDPDIDHEVNVGDDELIDVEKFVNAHLPSSDGFGEGYGNVEHVTLERRPFIKLPQRMQDDVFLRRPKITTGVDPARLAEWAKQNEKGRDNVARGTASAAVTGHGKTTHRTKSIGLGIASSSQARRPARSATVSSLTSRIKKEWAE